MAVIQLSDLIVPSVFTPYMQQLSVELNRLIQSGIVGTSADLVELIAGAGKTFDMPHYNDLGNTEANVSSDNPASSSTPEKITTGKGIAIRHSRNQSWSDMDLNSALVGNDPMAAVAKLVAGYWLRQDQRALISGIKGIIADNIANDGSDMIHVIGNDSADAITDAELFSAEAVITAEQTMGDAQDGLVAICMHSVIFARARIQNLIDYMLDSDGKPTIPTYLGKEVLVDDTMPAVAGSNRILYDTYLFGRSAFGWAEGTPKTPTEVERDAAAGDGGGQETLHSRREFILSPPGFQWTSSSMALNSPTNAELELAANWDRVYDRKIVRMAVLRTNG